MTNRFSITSVSDYSAQFAKANGAKALGEVCPFYLYSKKAPERIQHYVPDAKIIMLLRNPVDRAYASFMHRLLNDREPYQDFEKALDEEPKRIQENWDHLWHYKNMGLYFEQVNRFMQCFQRNQIQNLFI